SPTARGASAAGSRPRSASCRSSAASSGSRCSGASSVVSARWLYCERRSGACDGRARSSLLRRSLGYASSVVAALARLGSRLDALATSHLADTTLDTAPMAMTLEVYASDAEAFEAAAALAAEHLRSAGARATVALAGGRSGRGVKVALAAGRGLPWERVEWFWGDERCVPADDGRSNL